MKRLLTIAALLAVATPGFAADSPNSCVLEGCRTDLPEEVPGVPSANSIAPCRHHFQEDRPWARSIKERVATRQMPPWHIDAPSRRTSRTTCRWRREGRHQRSLGRPARRKAIPRHAPRCAGTDNGWGAESRLRPDRPDREASEYTMRRAPGLVPPDADIPRTEPRWVKRVEIRPTT